MPRLMSVSMTEQAVVERRKTVTRRKGWWLDSRGRRLVVPGDHLILCRKVMGRRPGEPLVRLAEVEVLDVRRELLGQIYQEPDGVAREGFPDMHPAEFIRRFFEEPQGIQPAADVTRIEWRYVTTSPSARDTDAVGTPTSTAMHTSPRCWRDFPHPAHDVDDLTRCPGYTPPLTIPAERTHAHAQRARKEIWHA